MTLGYAGEGLCPSGHPYLLARFVLPRKSQSSAHNSDLAFPFWHFGFGRSRPFSTGNIGDQIALSKNKTAINSSAT